MKILQARYRDVNSDRNATTVSEPIWTTILAVSRLQWPPEKVRTFDLGPARLEIKAGGHFECRGPLADVDRDALRLLLPIATAAGPFALAQLGQSLDGRIATESGDSHYINGPELRAHLHRLRALVDAVVIGASTAVEDRPQMTVRLVEGPNPVPVIIDPHGRVPSSGPLFDGNDRPPRVLHLIGTGLNLPPAPAHVERIELQADEQGFSPQAILDALGERGLNRVLIEGGGQTVSRFLEADALDRLHLLIAPLLIGSGRPGLALEPIGKLSEARRPAMQSVQMAGELIVDLDLIKSKTSNP